MSHNPFNVPISLTDHSLDASAVLAVNHTGNLNRLASGGSIPFTDSKSDYEELKEYSEQLEAAANLLASEVITGAEFFKVKNLLKSKDSEVRKLGVIFLNKKSEIL